MLRRNANKRSPFPSLPPSRPIQAHASEDLCVDVTSTEVNLDDLDERSLAIAVLSVDF